MNDKVKKGNESVTNCNQLKMQAEGSELSEKIGQLKMQAPDGKMRLTDVVGRAKQSKVIFLPQRFTKGFHKEHKMLINNILSLCSFVCTLCSLWLRKPNSINQLIKIHNYHVLQLTNRN